MAQDLHLKLVITAENGVFKASIRDSEGELKRFGMAGERAGEKSNQAFSEMRRNMRSIRDQLQGLQRLAEIAFAARALAHFVEGLTHITDEAKRVRGQLTLVTDSTAELDGVQKKIYQIALNTHQSVEAIATLYTRTARSVHALHLGTSNQKLLDFASTLSKILVLSHAPSSTSQNALFQLSQGIGENRLQGQNLRAVLSDIPLIGHEIARGMKAADGSIGITLNQFRQLANAGKIGAAEIITALARVKTQVDAQYKNVPLRIEQAMEDVHTSIVKAFGSFDQAGHYTQTLANLIEILAQHMDALIAAVTRLGTAAAAAFIAFKANALLGWIDALQAGSRAAHSSAAAVRAAAAARIEEAAAAVRETEATLAQTRAAVANAAAQARLGGSLAEVTAAEEQLALAETGASAAAARLATARGTATSSLAARSIALVKTRGAVGTLTLALSRLGSIAIAAFVGWKIGKWLDSIQSVRQAFDVAFGYIMIGWERVKEAMLDIAPAFELTFAKVIDSVRAEFGKLVADIGTGIAKLPAWLGGGAGATLQGFGAALQAPRPGGLSERAAAQLAANHAQANANIATDRWYFIDGGRESLRDIHTGGASGAGGNGAPPAGQQTANADVGNAQAALITLKDALARRKAALDAALADNRISYQDYYAALATMQKQSLAAQIAEKRAEVAKLAAKGASGEPDAGTGASGAKRKQLLAQIAVLQKQMGDADAQAAAKTTAANKKLAEQLTQVKEKYKAITDPLGAQIDAIKAKYAKLIADLKTNGMANQVPIVLKLETAEEGQATEQSLEAQAQKIVEHYRQLQQSLQAQVAIKRLTPTGAQNALAAGMTQARAAFDQLIARAQALHSVLGASIITDLQRMKAQLLGLRAPANEILQSLVSGGGQDLQNFFQNLISGSENAGQAFRNFGRAIAETLANIAAKLLEMQIVKGVLGAFGYQIAPSGQVVRAPVAVGGGTGAASGATGGQAAGGETTGIVGVGGAATGKKTAAGGTAAKALTGAAGALTGAAGRQTLAAQLWQITSSIFQAFTTTGSAIETTAATSLQLAAVVLNSAAWQLVSAAIAIQSAATSSSISSAFSSFGGAGGKAGGGPISGPGTETSDSIPARLSTGEFVVRGKAVRAAGVRALSLINSGRVREGALAALANLRGEGVARYAYGGLVSPAAMSPGAASMPTRGGASVSVSAPINVHVATGDNMDEDQAKSHGKKLGLAFRAAIQREIVDQQRPGGLLYPSAA